MRPALSGLAHAEGVMVGGNGYAMGIVGFGGVGRGVVCWSEERELLATEAEARDGQALRPSAALCGLKHEVDLPPVES